MHDQLTFLAGDETAQILAERSPDKWRDYALMEAERLYRVAKEAAAEAYRQAGGNSVALASPQDQRGEPLYDALVSAIQDAAAERAARRDHVTAAFRAAAPERVSA
jgi:hypothetical protein